MLNLSKNFKEARSFKVAGMLKPKVCPNKVEYLLSHSLKTGNLIHTSKISFIAFIFQSWFFSPITLKLTYQVRKIKMPPLNGLNEDIHSLDFIGLITENDFPIYCPLSSLANGRRRVSVRQRTEKGPQFF